MEQPRVQAWPLEDFVDGQGCAAAAVDGQEGVEEVRDACASVNCGDLINKPDINKCLDWRMRMAGCVAGGAANG